MHQRWRLGYHRWSEANIAALNQQVAAKLGFRDVLLEQLLRLLTPQCGRDPGQQPLLQAGPNDNLCSTAGWIVIQLIDRSSCQTSSVQCCMITTKCHRKHGQCWCALHAAGGTTVECLPASSPDAARRSLSGSAAASSTNSAPTNVVSSSERQLPGVPRLNLPPGAMAMPRGGLTRSSRRAGSNWSSPAPSPKLSPAPFFLGQSRCLEANAKLLAGPVLGNTHHLPCNQHHA